MPVRSVAQMQAMRAAMAGKSTIGIPRKVAQEFIAETPSKASLPERVKSVVTTRRNYAK